MSSDTERERVDSVLRKLVSDVVEAKETGLLDLGADVTPYRDRILEALDEGERVDLLEHKCEKIADLSPRMTGPDRELWIGRLLEPIPGYPEEEWCIHIRTPEKPEIVFGHNFADFEFFAVLSLAALGRHINPRWLERMAEKAYRDAGKLPPPVWDRRALHDTPSSGEEYKRKHFLWCGVWYDAPCTCRARPDSEDEGEGSQAEWEAAQLREAMYQFAEAMWPGDREWADFPPDMGHIRKHVLRRLRSSEDEGEVDDLWDESWFPAGSYIPSKTERCPECQHLWSLHSEEGCLAEIAQENIGTKSCRCTARIISEDKGGDYMTTPWGVARREDEGDSEGGEMIVMPTKGALRDMVDSYKGAPGTIVDHLYEHLSRRTSKPTRPEGREEEWSDRRVMANLIDYAIALGAEWSGKTGEEVDLPEYQEMRKYEREVLRRLRQSQGGKSQRPQKGADYRIKHPFEGPPLVTNRPEPTEEE